MGAAGSAAARLPPLSPVARRAGAAGSAAARLPPLSPVARRAGAAGSGECRDGGTANAGTGLSSSPSLFSLRLPHCALSPFPDLEPARTSELRWRHTWMRGCSVPSSFPASSSAAALQRRLQLDPGTTMAALGFRFGIGLAGGLSQWARRWALVFFCFFQMINRGDQCNVPVVVKVYLPLRAR